MSLEEFGRELRDRRRALGLTAAGLAEAVGTRPVALGRWERGEARPTLDEVMRLAGILNLDPAVEAEWSAMAAPPAPEPTPVPAAGAEVVAAGPPSATEPSRPEGLRRLSALLAIWRRRPGGLPDEAAGEDVRRGPGPSPSGGSYLDDPAEQRRYALRWALTLLVLGALAVGLVWALWELRGSWDALLDLFRGRPAGPGVTRALPWLLLN